MTLHDCLDLAGALAVVILAAIIVRRWLRGVRVP